jgi:heme-degrading monooxygenase HmoA
MVGLFCKTGCKEAVCRGLEESVLPGLREQPGMLGDAVLLSSSDARYVVLQSFWRSREDAERYDREYYPSLRLTLRERLACTPALEGYEVESWRANAVEQRPAA